MRNLTIVLSNIDPSGIECSNILLWRTMCTLRADNVRMASSSNDLQLPGIPSEIQYLLSFQRILVFQSFNPTCGAGPRVYGLGVQSISFY